MMISVSGFLLFASHEEMENIPIRQMSNIDNLLKMLDFFVIFIPFL